MEAAGVSELLVCQIPEGYAGYNDIFRFQSCFAPFWGGGVQFSNILLLWFQCKPEYKVPGLYVIDSIVRQSRHQFGAEKDVFAPRFAKNMQTTFINLFRCPPEDKVSSACILLLCFIFPLSFYTLYLGLPTVHLFNVSHLMLRETVVILPLYNTYRVIVSPDNYQLPLSVSLVH